MKALSNEFRFCELRTDGDRTICGTAIHYGDEANIAGLYRERFAQGAFGNVGTLDVILNVQHDRGRVLTRTGAGLHLQESTSELTIRADLPTTREADDVLTLIRQRVLRGLSIEFRPIQERYIDGVRVIDKALLRAIAVVDTPAYKESVVEARHKEFMARVDPAPYILPFVW